VGFPGSLKEPLDKINDNNVGMAKEKRISCSFELEAYSSTDRREGWMGTVKDEMFLTVEVST
jgi:hypothetical protein